ncbi:MAG: hypothetical protein V2B15_03475 [Bacteroidota bacterium]
MSSIVVDINILADICSDLLHDKSLPGMTRMWMSKQIIELA